MRRARIIHEGRTQWAEVRGDDNILVLADGRSVPAGEVTWLPPVTPGATIFALGLNFADHNALDHVSGYTVACDYAIREYLENYYRPNLRVKNRDATTPIGPWIVDAEDIPDPQALAMTTRVNGAEIQAGSTADMIMDVAGVIEFLSQTMTLMPGDMILTGTPKGLHFVAAGDEVICEIENIGQLRNRVEAP